MVPGHQLFSEPKVDRLINVAEYHVENFGCRASRADGESIAAGLRRAGLLEAAGPVTADVVVLNTCSVTAEADRDARAYLRKVRRANPAARVVVTGCYAQRAPDEVAALDGVDVVVGNSHKSRVAETAVSLLTAVRTPPGFVALSALLEAENASKAVVTSVFHDPEFAHAELSELPFAADAHQTRPNLKVQDGCGNRCSFCIIPVTRGPSRSISLDEILRGIDQFAGKELVLSGINLGRWGRDLQPNQRFEDLIATILERTGLPRLRISSVEPMDWSADLIALLRQYGKDDGGDGPRLARHAHLPLQSGSDTILRAMHRRYRPWHYAAKVEEVHAAVPEAAIGADVMIGFPGETEFLFRETYDFLEKLPLTYLHVFPFSARPGTRAYQLHQETPVHGEAVNERKTALKSLIARKHAMFRQGFLGGDLAVVTLAGGDESSTEALSDNFLRVTVRGRFSANQLLRVRVTQLSGEGLRGEAIPAS
jgi:threonylcarbamoyladenosine tRNA methylthiotransferase MtaB